ncbi:hypothetical protein Tco_0818849 [Tanacetum coccineum]
MATSKHTVVMYHYPCPDGAFAALAAHIYFSAASLPVRFFPNNAGGFFFYFGPDFRNSKIFSRVKLSALENGNNLRGRESGNKFECSRKLFEYIEDADLWRWRLHNSKAFSSGLKDMNIEFNEMLNPSIFQQLLSLDVEHVVNKGLSSLSQKQTLINEVLDQSYEIVIDDGASGTFAWAVDADAVSDLRSELGNQLAEKSRNQNLEKYGGGGHRNASSFMLSCVEFEKWKRKTGFGFVTSWREEDLIREIYLYMPIYQCRLFSITVIILDYHKTALKMLDEGEFSSENVTKLLYLDVEHVINQAMSSLSHKQTLINEVLDQSYEIVLNDEASGHSLAVDGDDVSDLRSELGNQLAEKSRNQT